MKYLGIYIAITTLLFSVSCKKDHVGTTAKAKSTLKNVKVTPIDQLHSSESISASGILSSKKEITLSFKIGGIVDQLLVEEGQSFSSSKKLAALNLAEINAKVTSAEQGYEKAIRDLKRATNLYNDTVGTLEQMQNAETAKQVAEAQLEISRFNQLHAKIEAPVRGKVLKRYVETGELVQAGQPVYTIGSSGSVGSQIIRIGLADKDIVKISLGDKADVRFDAFEKSYSGSISEIAEAAYPQTGLFEVELSLNDYHDELKNGFIGKIVLHPSQSNSTLKIPMDALVEGKGKQATIFYTQNAKTVTKQVVSVQSIRDDYFTISTELLPNNAAIVTAGAPYLQPNDSIHIIQ